MFKILLYLFISVYLVQAKHEEFVGYTLYGVTVDDPAQIDQLKEIVERYTLDVWTYGIAEHENLILVAPELRKVFEDEISALGLTYRVDTYNIKEKLDLEDKLLAEAELKANSTRDARFGLSFDVIHRYAVVDRYIQDVAIRFPRVARVVNAGRSVEGRDIRYLRVSADNFATRMWRKNRRTGFVPANCIGVDLNRNFDFNWGTLSSNNPCSDIFHGPRAFSEPEAVVSRNIISQFRARISMFLDIHSFGSMVLFGFGNRQLPPNSAVLTNAGVEMARRIDAVKWAQHPNYRVGNSAQILGTRDSGTCSDYAQMRLTNKLSYTYELPAHRNQNTVNGFLVEPAFIRQAGFETWEGIKAGARFVVRNRI